MYVCAFTILANLLQEMKIKVRGRLCLVYMCTLIKRDSTKSILAVKRAENWVCDRHLPTINTNLMSNKATDISCPMTYKIAAIFPKLSWHFCVGVFRTVGITASGVGFVGCKPCKEEDTLL